MRLPYCVGKWSEMGLRFFYFHAANTAKQIGRESRAVGLRRHVGQLQFYDKPKVIADQAAVAGLIALCT
jgi:hypothetical protein